MVEVVDPPVKMKGKVYQVHSHLNGKGSVVPQKQPQNRNGETPTQRQAKKFQAQIDYRIKKHNYQCPGIITYEKFKDFFGNMKKWHFYGERGTNEFVGCDAIFVLGAPMPHWDEVVTMSKMIYYDRDEPFEETRNTKDVAYNYVDNDGYGRSYPIRGFWNDPDLQVVLHQLREAEIEQAAHRGRPD